MDESWKDQWLKAEPGRRSVCEYFDNEDQFTCQLMMDDSVVSEVSASTSEAALAAARSHLDKRHA